MPCVVPDCARQWRPGTESVLHIISQTLRAFADRPIVNGIGTDRVHLPAAPASTERNHRPEHIVENLPFAGSNMGGNFVAIFRVARLSQPGANVLGCARSKLTCGDRLFD